MPCSRFIFVAFILITLSVAQGSAVSISIPATHIDAGEPVRVSITNLHDGATFVLITEGVYPVRPGNPLLFQLSGFQVPFSLLDGEIFISAKNIRWISYTVKLGNTSIGIEASPETGNFTHTELWNVSASNYTFLRLEAIPLDATIPITSRLQVAGRKYGFDTTNLSFIPEGVENGRIRVIILVDGVRQVDQVITIGDGEGIPGSGHIMQSPDGMVTITGMRDPLIGIHPGTSGHVPEGWKPVTDSYHLVSDTTDLGSGTIITFRIPANIAAENGLYNLSIARSDNNSWEVLPSRIEENGNLISAPIQSTGEYCLMAIRMTDPAPSPTQLPLSVLIPLASLGSISILLIIPSGTKR